MCPRLAPSPVHLHEADGSVSSVLGAAVSAQMQAPLSAGSLLSLLRLPQDHTGRDAPRFGPLELRDAFAKFASSRADLMKAAASGLNSYDMTTTCETPRRCYTA
jgi:hypothetical protein